MIDTGRSGCALGSRRVGEQRHRDIEGVTVGGVPEGSPRVSGRSSARGGDGPAPLRSPPSRRGDVGVAVVVLAVEQVDVRPVVIAVGLADLTARGASFPQLYWRGSMVVPLSPLGAGSWTAWVAAGAAAQASTPATATIPKIEMQKADRSATPIPNFLRNCVVFILSTIPSTSDAQVRRFSRAVCSSQGRRRMSFLRI